MSATSHQLPPYRILWRKPGIHLLHGHLIASRTRFGKHVSRDFEEALESVIVESLVNVIYGDQAGDNVGGNVGGSAAEERFGGCVCGFACASVNVSDKVQTVMIFHVDDDRWIELICSAQGDVGFVAVIHGLWL